LAAQSVALSDNAARADCRPSATVINQAARVLRPGGCFSSTEAAGDPDRVTGMELDDYAKRAGLAKGESWSGWLVKTFNYRKPA
jgi:hypothetical protein